MGCSRQIVGRNLETHGTHGAVAQVTPKASGCREAIAKQFVELVKYTWGCPSMAYLQDFSRIPNLGVVVNLAGNHNHRFSVLTLLLFEG